VDLNTIRELLGRATLVSVLRYAHLRRDVRVAAVVEGAGPDANHAERREPLSSLEVVMREMLSGVGTGRGTM